MDSVMELALVGLRGSVDAIVADIFSDFGSSGGSESLGKLSDS